jgi:serralysin
MKKFGTVLKGGGDDFVIQGTKWNDVYHGDYGGVAYPDAYNGRGGHDLIAGWNGADWLWGGSGNDSIYGYIGSDRLYGGSGNDTLSGGRQSDVISGGSGADVFLFRAWPFEGSQLDTITDFDPRERGEHVQLQLSAFDYGLATFSDLKSLMFEDDGDIILDFDGDNILVLKNLRIEQLSANDFQIQLI